MRIEDFSWVMIGTYAIFIPDRDYMAVYKKLKQKRLIVFYDDWCPNCVRFTTIINRIDFLGNIEFKALRSQSQANLDQYGVDLNQSQEQMASYNLHRKANYLGFKSIAQIVASMPATYILVPFFWLLSISSIGQWLYMELAKKRAIIPLHCNQDCKIQP